MKTSHKNNINNNEKPWIIFPFHEESDVMLNSIIRELGDCPCPMIVVDDGSDPKYSSGDLPVRVIRHPKRLGKGAAIASAIKNVIASSKSDSAFILTVDSDGQHCPEDIKGALEIWEKAGHENIFLSGERDFRDSSVPFSSRIGRSISSLLIKIETGKNILDTQNGLRVYPVEFFRKFKIRSKGFGFETETLVVALTNGYKLMTFPTRTIYSPTRKSRFRKFVDPVKISILHAKIVVSLIMRKLKL
jgi:glycosyltransferase involved in cell wall biosynthesis